VTIQSCCATDDSTRVATWRDRFCHYSSSDVMRPITAGLQSLCGACQCQLAVPSSTSMTIGDTLATDTTASFFVTFSSDVDGPLSLLSARIIGITDSSRCPPALCHTKSCQLVAVH